ncbi:single-stranded DNA-binding protein [Anaerotignum lactatifermentans]|uniref:Single-stranded DNA-binding protein n=1 Tax=Anaerotignum lactatifermentans TaxID=160404 RepID=A0ABS2GAS0_9FIRM|nr:single-stranded DNA-binding protein [Anaerotignum lactatifermentans]MBM6828329.1 single-stranded DNA-binding protein [Anaerotignum lactatifermentans]MBM6877609.1 single-stranded DNA-binding protein [Anaerotignum lactatifermentans]MBM6949912.1 single-stranded DNA-binding protein [Anaerotignum lactatifermentans]
MQINNWPENNKVTVTGIVAEEAAFSHEVYGEGFYTFKIASERLSDQADILPVMISERILAVSGGELKKGSRIRIVGQLRSYNNYTETKSRLVLTIFARELSLRPEETTAAVNEIHLQGYICKKPIYRKTPFGREISDILVAVNRAYNKSDYIPCIVWGRNARYVDTVQVGTPIEIRGRIQSRTYQKKLGDVVEERVAYEVSVSQISLAEGHTGEKTEKGGEGVTPTV